MLPNFTIDGLLPEGVHRATPEEFERRFVYFDRSDRRFRLFEKLRLLIEEARKSGIVRRILVGGSFVTSKPEPNDFDCIVVVDASIEGDTLRPIEYNLVSLSMARRIFGGDVIPALEGTSILNSYLALFQKTRHGVPVGIVEIEL
jgi:hypothetical protein